jgi:low temperature requirement protein LtrA
MLPRDTAEEERAATPLELLFDLCFVVAIAQASGRLHHALVDDDIGSAVVSYVLVFFAIWWAWMNFTWFSSAYDNDDVIYRLLTLLQITGVLILAAGVPRAFDTRNFDIMFVGYAVMRVGLVTLWLRAAYHDRERRTADLRFAAGVSLCMVGWAAVLVAGWPLWGFVAMGIAELAVPFWGERAARTPWHAGHIAERYGLFTLIVLGESIASATIAFQVAVDGRHTSTSVYLVAIGGLLTVFAVWWLYFAKSASRFLVSNRVGFDWGYGHYVIFSAAAAVGAGLAVNVDEATHHAELSRTAAAATVTIPVALFLLALWFLQIRPHRAGPLSTALFPVAAVLVLAASFVGQAVLVTGVVLAVLVAVAVVLHERQPTPQ